MAINTLLQANITDKIIGSFFAVYNELGFGFLESVYANAMLVELSRRKALVKREVPVEVYFEGDPIGAFRLDMLVDEVVLVEVKSTELLSGAAERQVLNYLRATKIEVGMLLHFGPKPRYRRFVYSNSNKRFNRLDPR
jgi:GxxExxY protein